MNNKTLAQIFAVLLVIFALSFFLNKPKTRSFDALIAQIDTSAVDLIKLYPKAENGQEIILQKSNHQWTVARDNFTAPATTTAVKAILDNLVKLVAKRIVANSTEKWVDYEVDEESGSKVIVLSGDKELSNLVIGRFSFDQMARSGTSFLRKSGENEVYSVDGFLSMTFNRDFNSFRNKELINLNREDITQLNLNSSSLGNYTLQKQGNDWMANGNTIDSVKMASFLSDIRFANGQNFKDDYSVSESNRIHKLEIIANNQLTPTVISCYSSQDTIAPFVIHSTVNPQAYFTSDSAGVYRKFFRPLSELLPE